MTIQITLTDVTGEFMEAPSPETGETLRIVLYTDIQSGIQIAVPHNREAAQAISRFLGRPYIELASDLP